MNDETLRRAFRRLREREAASAPAFRRLIALRPEARRTLWIPGAALLLVALVALWLGWPKRSAPPASLADWTSPTDFLLEAPAPELLRSTPEIPEPIPDYSDALSLPEKGVSS